MHFIIFFSIYLLFYEKVIIVSKCIKFGLIMINSEEYLLSLSLLEIIISFSNVNNK